MKAKRLKKAIVANSLRGVIVTPVKIRCAAMLGGLVAVVLPLAAQDRPLQIVMDPPAEFPQVIGHDESPRGSVTLVIGVSSSGEFLDALVTAYTHIEYAREARRAAAAWTYHPAIVGGKPVGVRQEIVLKFEPDGMIRQLAPVNTIDHLFEKSVPKDVTQVFFPERELDAPLALVAAPAPPSVTIPEDMQVTVEFFVDQEGKARLPTICSMDSPVLARLALETIKEWRFNPPSHDGKPAITRARQQFVFHGHAEAKKREESPGG